MIELTKAELTTAKRVATESERRYRGYVDFGDVQSELWIWMYLHEKRVREWREGMGFKALFRSLKNEAHRYCEREKAAKVGYSYGDNLTYNPAVLREYLPDALKTDYSMVTGVDGEPHAAMTQKLIDVRRALQMVGPLHAEVLVKAVAAGFDYEQMAEQETTEEYAPTDVAMRQRVYRALRALGDILNQPREESEPDPFKTIPRYCNANIIRHQLGEVE